MPCTKQMAGCAATCGHRAMVEDYRLARHNDEVALEGPLKEERLDTPLITFKAWLVGLTAGRPDVVTALPEPAIDPDTAAAWAAA